mmetsp:Transcript_32793/g.76547  ORF Transcript_32793/g.76547 Transcript_32793/m.76547 type:complete len:110 (+) Transcript_32793:106-435(+)
MCAQFLREQMQKCAEMCMGKGAERRCEKKVRKKGTKNSTKKGYHNNRSSKRFGCPWYARGTKTGALEFSLEEVSNARPWPVSILGASILGGAPVAASGRSTFGVEGGVM